MWLYYRTLLGASKHTLRHALPILLAGRGLSPEQADRHIHEWSKSCVDDVRLRLTVTGLENLEPRVPLIVMSNHQSLYDVPVLFQALPIRMRMLAKVELFRIPVFGGAMRAAGFIPVDRNNRTKAIESVNYARDLLDSGASVFVAPEGTRSPTGALLPFKKGGFILAEETGLPILPVTLDGAAAILPARTRTLHLDREVRVVIHPRISPQGLKRDELMSRVRTAIASGLSVRGPA